MPDGDLRVKGTRRERKQPKISVYAQVDGVWTFLRDVEVKYLPAYTLELVQMRYKSFMFKKPGKYSPADRDKVIEASVHG